MNAQDLWNATTERETATYRGMLPGVPIQRLEYWYNMRNTSWPIDGDYHSKKQDG